MKNLIVGRTHIKVKDYLSDEDKQPKVQLIHIGKRIRSKRITNPVVWSSEIEDAKEMIYVTSKR